jgi:uncharacterized protein (DUF433 family)
MTTLTIPTARPNCHSALRFPSAANFQRHKMWDTMLGFTMNREVRFPNRMAIISRDLSTMRDRNELLKRISIDPRVCFGRPVIRGTRIWVSLVVDNLAEGIPEAELLAAYPQLRPEDIRAALAYAAEMTRERIIPIPTEPVPA